MARDVEKNGVRYRIGAEAQVIRLEAGDPSRAELPGRLRDVMGSSRFVSAALLAHKAKQVDDGLYAALELAAERGAGLVRGKREVLEALLARVSGEGDARATLEAAASLGEGRESAPGRASELRAAHLADEQRSKPIGFYTWTDELGRIFQQDRLLQSDLAGATDLLAVAHALRSDPALRASYEASIRLPERLTNALAFASLRDAMKALDEGRFPDPLSPIAFLPPSKAHETELVKKLYGDRPIPSDFDLSKALVAAIRSGAVDLALRDTSGWYDVQTWALETLAAPARGAEAKRLELDATYLAHLEELFRGILTATRETHVKQLEIAMAGSAPFKPKAALAPELTVEPLVTYYQRRADSYRFVRAVLVEVFGEESLATLHGLRRGAPVKEPLGIELGNMIHLFDGAAATAMRELGMPTEWDTSVFEAWRGGAGDPDVDEDIRMMVPVFYDVERRRTKVWMILGWAPRTLTASFATPPRVETKGLLGWNEADVDFVRATYVVATPIMIEAYVTRVLDRDEVRAHCAKHRTSEAIALALA